MLCDPLKGRPCVCLCTGNIMYTMWQYSAFTDLKSSSSLKTRPLNYAKDAVSNTPASNTLHYLHKFNHVFDQKRPPGSVASKLWAAASPAEFLLCIVELSWYIHLLTFHVQTENVIWDCVHLMQFKLKDGCSNCKIRFKASGIYRSVRL